MLLKTRIIEPFQRSDGSWDTTLTERMEEYPVDKPRDFGYCNKCGDMRYPECVATCFLRQEIPLKDGWDA